MRNGTLRDVVVATGSDGYAAAFPAGELDPRFGGGATRPVLVAHEANGAPLDEDGFARLVVPGDAAGGRYVSNLVGLEVLDATAATRVPEPSTLALLVPVLAGFVARRGRRGASAAVASGPVA